MHCEGNASLNLIFDEMLSDEAKPELRVLITEPGGAVTDEKLWQLGCPQSLKNLEKLLKAELTGMLISLRHWFRYRPKKLQFYEKCQKMLGLASFRPSTSEFSASPFHLMTTCSLTSSSSNRQAAETAGRTANNCYSRVRYMPSMKYLTWDLFS